MTPGSYVVTDGWRYEVHRVDRATPMQVWTTADSLQGRRRLDRAVVLFSGTQEECCAVAETLTSSKALATSEKRACDERHAARVARIVRVRA